MRPRQRTGRRGMTLIEAVISMLIVSIMMVAALRMVGSSARARQAHASRRRGPALARQLVAEIVTAFYAEPNGTGPLGPDAGESGFGRTGFDDVDDYHGWTASPPTAPDGSAMSHLAGWRRSASVQYVNPNDPDQTVGQDAGLKRVTVTVTDPQGRRSVHTALRSSYGLYEQRPAQATTYVTWVGLDLQIGPDTGGRVSTGASVLNRVAAQGE